MSICLYFSISENTNFKDHYTANPDSNHNIVLLILKYDKLIIIGLYSYSPLFFLILKYEGYKLKLKNNISIFNLLLHISFNTFKNFFEKPKFRINIYIVIMQ